MSWAIRARPSKPRRMSAGTVQMKMRTEGGRVARGSPQGVDDASEGLGIEAWGDGDAESIGEDDLDGRGRRREEPARWRCRGANDWEKQRSAVGGGLRGRARRSRAAAGLVEVIAEGGQGEAAPHAELGLGQPAEPPLGDEVRPGRGARFDDRHSLISARRVDGPRLMIGEVRLI